MAMMMHGQRGAPSLRLFLQTYLRVIIHSEFGQKYSKYGGPGGRLGFNIEPPWYASAWAYLVYTLLGSGFLYAMICIPQRQYAKEKAVLKIEQKAALLRKEAAHQLTGRSKSTKNPPTGARKLELELKAKNRELTSNAMHLVQKSEIMNSIKADLEKIVKSSKDASSKKHFNRSYEK